ncbi:uncharacterized protein LOC106153298 [Lingula anatina]|uniref:Uncharacterized protein LOC106153298 n=1 Tax=Lingula anatina TaxID=7574 RepID=A0A1S3H9E7_LINAN|nr:uncharacterized protein LOC106153298 [Lingula anatina]|eukprot:XP_013382627.1 uncharacterized protein LOC106153298 [Lingula anatina]
MNSIDRKEIGVGDHSPVVPQIHSEIEFPPLSKYDLIEAKKAVRTNIDQEHHEMKMADMTNSGSMKTGQEEDFKNSSTDKQTENDVNSFCEKQQNQQKSDSPSKFLMGVDPSILLIRQNSTDNAQVSDQNMEAFNSMDPSILLMGPVLESAQTSESTMNRDALVVSHLCKEKQITTSPIKKVRKGKNQTQVIGKPTSEQLKTNCGQQKPRIEKQLKASSTDRKEVGVVGHSQDVPNIQSETEFPPLSKYGPSEVPKEVTNSKKLNVKNGKQKVQKSLPPTLPTLATTAETDDKDEISVIETLALKTPNFWENEVQMTQKGQTSVQETEAKQLHEGAVLLRQGNVAIAVVLTSMNFKLRKIGEVGKLKDLPAASSFFYISTDV